MSCHVKWLAGIAGIKIEVIEVNPELIERLVL